MFVYEEAWDYKGNLNSDLADYKIKQEKIYDRIELKEENIEKIKNIKSTINIVVFAEIYCPDCRALIPFIEKFNRLNEKINLNIFPREGNEKYLEIHSELSRIPLVLIEDIQKGEDEFVNIFEERLPSINEKLSELEKSEEKDDLIYRWRTGKFNEELEEYLIKRILEFA